MPGVQREDLNHGRNMTQPSAICRRCGAALSASEARGLCPACLLESSLSFEGNDDPNIGGVDAAWLEQHGVTAPHAAAEGARRSAPSAEIKAAENEEAESP